MHTLIHKYVLYVKHMLIDTVAQVKNIKIIISPPSSFFLSTARFPIQWLRLDGLSTMFLILLSFCRFNVIPISSVCATRTLQEKRMAVRS